MELTIDKLKRYGSIKIKNPMRTHQGWQAWLACEIKTETLARAIRWADRSFTSRNSSHIKALAIAMSQMVLDPGNGAQIMAKAALARLAKTIRESIKH